MRRIVVAALAIIFSQHALAGPTKKVRIDFAEALAPRDTTSSERFQRDYESAIELGKSLLKSKLAKCGYELETKTAFYEASDALKAKEIGAAANEQGAWLIVGPRRSNHYLLLAQGAGSTPTVSLMASADDVAKLARGHISLSPTNTEMAVIAAREAKTRAGKSSSYLSIFSDDCTTCVDFAQDFDRAAQKAGLRKLTEIAVRGEDFSLEPILKAVQVQKPSFVLLPNYSKVAARVMHAFNNDPHPPLFVGSDGWGDQRYGFVQAGAEIENVSGVAVRGFPPVEKGLLSFPLGREATSRHKDLPFSGPSMGILRIIEETANTLCSSRPNNRASFATAFQKTSARLHSPWGVSVYELKSGQTAFQKTVGAR